MSVIFSEQFAINAFTSVKFERLIPANSKIFISQLDTYHFLKIVNNQCSIEKPVNWIDL